MCVSYPVCATYCLTPCDGLVSLCRWCGREIHFVFAESVSIFMYVSESERICVCVCVSTRAFSVFDRERNECGR